MWCSASHEGPPKDERRCCLETVYDRCLPSAIAFADPGAAEAFARQHGGLVTQFDALKPGRGPILGHRDLDVPAAKEPERRHGFRASSV